ncbi:hypothetical protein [Candidatus Villigracilis affinis]
MTTSSWAVCVGVMVAAMVAVAVAVAVGEAAKGACFQKNELAAGR